MSLETRAIAIVGLGCILPDAPTVTAFWDNILGRKYSITDVPPERWNPDHYYDPDPLAPDKTYSKIGGWVRGFEFDWKHYRLPPRVANAMDQGQQWAVTIAQQALADYGYPERPLDLERTGVILGTAMGGELHYITHLRIAFPEFAAALQNVSEFSQLPPAVRDVILKQWHKVIDERLPPITEDSMPGELPNVVSGRVANLLNLRGPNFITDAACASSFAAIDAAVELLMKHQVDAVISGGVDRNMGASSFVKFCKIGALSATGTRPFGDGADGFVMGEGSGAFLLKRLDDAERDGDKIYAVIRGVGASSDGKGKGITAPNPQGQVLAIQRAWQMAQLDPATASLVEAHGTSTKVGDVVEVESLTRVFGGAARGSIALGSVKSNIGHLKAGAGAAGLLKTTLALHHKVLPPTLNAQQTNPNIQFDQTPFALNHTAREWPNGRTRRAGVSAYGFGGTNFHCVLEEYVPGALTTKKVFASAAVSQPKPPLRGILAMGAATFDDLKAKVDATLGQVLTGWTPAVAAPSPIELAQPERLVVDFGSREELIERLGKIQVALQKPNQGNGNGNGWRVLQAQGIFRGSGAQTGKLAFLFPGQGSQYLNMGRELAAREPVFGEVFAEADRVMTPILGKPLTDYLFVQSTDPADIAAADKVLMQTAITQPAMLTLDVAYFRLLKQYGFSPDYVMGHSLGEYAALVAAGVMPFAHALEAAAARGAEMTKVSMADNGWMAAVMAPFDVIEATLKEINGYVVAANINSKSQCVIGGASAAVEQAIEVFKQKGYTAQRIPVSHAFHTQIVAPASAPLRQMLNRLDVNSPRIPIVANVTGRLYPREVDAIKDLLERQIASPVQWVTGLETLAQENVTAFVEVGPKKALKGLVDDVFGTKGGPWSLFTNHPKTGELSTFNQALCGLYAAGFKPVETPAAIEIQHEASRVAPALQPEPSAPIAPRTPPVEVLDEAPIAIDVAQTTSGKVIAHLVAQAVSQMMAQTQAPARQPYDRNAEPLGSIVISGTGLGLPGVEKAVMDPENALRILRGEQFIDLIPERFRKLQLQKRITRVVKAADGSGSFETITNPDEVIKLAGRPGYFDLNEEYGVPAKLVEALDTTSQLAMAAGLDALREAGLPLVQTYRKATTGKYLPDRWQLPEALRDETGIIFASAFPGGDRFADELKRYYTYQGRLDQVAALEAVRQHVTDAAALREIDRRLTDLRDVLQREDYVFDRRFLFRLLSMGHSQFAEYIGARGPNTQVNAACASTAQAIAMAEDWIRTGRCRRVIVIGADNVTNDTLMEWVGAGFLATGAAATDDRVEEAALPFDRRRHGTIIGMGACALVVESEDAVRERGWRGIVELLSSEMDNSAFHGTRLDIDHISQVMNNLLTAAERRFGLNRYAIAPQLVFMSHETFTPARGGSASAEVAALRRTFAGAASEIVMANTKGFTGHPMGVGVEDVIAVKILEYGLVPPVPNHKEVDPELGVLNLSRGGRYNVQYAIHLAAGFGSQIALTLTRRIPGALERLDDRARYQRWLADVSGYDRAETEVVKRVLRVIDQGAPVRQPIGSAWQWGTGPQVRALAPGGTTLDYQPRPALAAPIAPRLEVAPHVDRAPRVDSVPAPEPVKVSIVEEPPVAAMPDVPPAPAVDAVKIAVLEIVSQKTGYPIDMLDLDLDMEADLGVDTVKQAETFAAIRARFDIPRRDDLRLRDYPTLNHVIQFVYDMRPDLKATTAAARPAAAIEPVSIAAVVPTPIVSVTPAVDDVKDAVLSIVAEKTGYPLDMLDLDLDMEADLGVDTVKQAETFAAIRARFNIPRRDDLKLRDYPTLNHVIQFVYDMRPDLKVTVAAAQPVAAIEPAPSTAAVPTPIVSVTPVTDDVKDAVLSIVAEKTGYPLDMLDLDLDMEADLGVDTVKQAETFAAIRARYDIPRRDDLRLRDYPTLNHVIKFVYDMRPDLKVTVAAARPAAAVEPPAAKPINASPSIGAIKYTLAEADRVARRVPVPTLRPALEWCKPTGVTLDANSRVIVRTDAQGVGAALIDQLRARGVTPLVLAESASTEALVAQVKAWLAEGAIQGVYWLTALDAEPALDQLDLATWRELNRVRVKDLYAALRSLYDAIAVRGTFLVTATRLGGCHGYDEAGALAPLGGAVTGFTKAYKRERPEVTVKAVDFEGEPALDVAAQLIAETLFDPGVVEVGYRGEQRFSIALAERSGREDQSGVALTADTVFVITGAAGGITSEIVTDLAQASGGVFYLLDLAGAPEWNAANIKLYRTNKEALKQKLIDELKAAGEKPTPVKVDKLLFGVERSEAALRAVEAVEAAGGVPVYHSVDLLDAAGLAAIVDDIRQRYGRIDVLLHAGGIEISRALPAKEAAEFNRVFDIKADGLFNLLSAAHDMKIGAIIGFSSVAGRFGNSGQTDYSAANDLLCKWLSSLRRTRPDTRALAIDWTAWGGIGMATRGSIPKIMELAGIDLLPPEAGVPTVRRELLHGGRGEIVVAGRLGIMTDEFDAQGGLDTAKIQAFLAQKPGGLIGEVKAAKLYGGLEVETTLDPTVQPFLFDHQLEGVPLLPGVMGTEAFAQLAAVLAPGYHVAAVYDEQFDSPFKFYRQQPRTLYLSAQLEPTDTADLIAHTTLKSIMPAPKADLPPQVKVHFTARVRLTRHPIVPPAITVDLPPMEALPLERAAIYKVFFHGPAYQVIERVGVHGDQALSLLPLDLPSDTVPANAISIMAPRLIELCFQTAGVWKIVTQGRMALPLSIEAVTTYRPLTEARGRVFAAVTARPDGAFDAQVQDETGQVLVTLTGYRTVDLPGQVSF